MIKKQLLRNDVVFILIVIIVCGGLTYRYIKRETTLENKHKYTVGKTTHVWKSYNKKNINYVFKVGDQEYNGEFDYKYDIVVPSGRYLVKYAIDNPSINRLYTNCWVPHDITPPLEGWDSIPLQLRGCNQRQ